MQTRLVAATLAVIATFVMVMPGTARAATVGVTAHDNFWLPDKVRAQQGDTVTWTNEGANRHTVTSFIGLFNGDISSGTSFSHVFEAAGKHAYTCTIHGFTGIVTVPLRLMPKSGTSATVFSVTWASAMPSGYVADVQIRRPTGTFKDWMTSQTALSSTFTPDQGPGTYHFRARLRNTATGDVSYYAGQRSITVN